MNSHESLGQIEVPRPKWHERLRARARAFMGRTATEQVVNQPGPAPELIEVNQPVSENNARAVAEEHPGVIGSRAWRAEQQQRRESREAQRQRAEFNRLAEVIGTKEWWARMEQEKAADDVRAQDHAPVIGRDGVIGNEFGYGDASDGAAVSADSQPRHLREENTGPFVELHNEIVAQAAPAVIGQSYGHVASHRA